MATRPPTGPADGRRGRRWPRLLLRAVLLLAAVILVIGTAVFFYARHEILAGRPPLGGEIVLPDLGGPVTVTRDSLGVVQLEGGSRLDLACALGFLHGQDRFFQMDLQRRRAAGELAELLGPALLATDRKARIHRFRTRSRQALAAASTADRDLLAAYAAGVNAGLASLAGRPFAYVLLRQDPQPWRAEDSFLMLASMFMLLDLESADGESSLLTLQETLPPPLASFLAPPGCEWDAPLQGEPFTTPPPPGPQVVDLRAGRRRGRLVPAANETAAEGGGAGSGGGESAGRSSLERRRSLDPGGGSNAWAVAGRLTAGSGALLANDMHLDLMVPNTWYRAVLIWPDPTAPGGRRRVVGVTLPGAPPVIVGSNGELAWGFTNSYGDWLDLVIVERSAGDPERYLAPGGERSFTHEREVIHVAGAPPETLEVVETIWGPLVGEDYRGRPLAMRWIAHDQEAVNLKLLALERAGAVAAGLAAAAACGIPPQNFVCADREGHIGWTICGRIPRRRGFSGRVARSWADGSCRWDGYLDPAEYPRILDPPGGLIWTANARVVGGEPLAVLGDGGYALGSRATQIRDSLQSMRKPDEADMLALQLDDRALFLFRWRDLLLGLLDGQAVAADSLRGEFRRVVADDWDGHASIGSAGYRLVRRFRSWTVELVYGWLTAPCREADPAFRYGGFTQLEGPLWRLVTERPMHLLDPEFDSWREALLAAVDSTAADLSRGGRLLASRTWGERNTTAIRHPLSRGLPALSCWLDMPSHPLPGDSHMPRVQHPAMGASERLVVSPGREEQGIFHMPTGQSGHPFSPFYAAGHRAWEQGLPTPLLPGPTGWTLVLRPPPAAGDRRDHP